MCNILYGLPVGPASSPTLPGMSLQTLLEEPHITISYDHLDEWIFADWHGEQNLASVQHGALEMLRHLRLQHCRKILNDNTKVTSLWSEAAEWGGKVWFPMVAAAGLEYFAWVYSPNHYSRLSTDLTIQYTAGTPVIATFDDLSTAMAWLRQM
ncbi:hypothetical protein GCM10023185_38970 [Hymenobacter saemangeumensis]|uniref:STAS/SEC14 domain-containing protein n=1 Tax=Hymenobacter saemangeumensis TaxID=1084522 RepID=A0ABP8IR56_9BACT